MNFDQTYILDFAKRLLATHSPSGYTQNAIAFIEQEIANWNYASYRTNKCVNIKDEMRNHYWFFFENHSIQNKRYDDIHLLQICIFDI